MMTLIIYAANQDQTLIGLVSLLVFYRAGWADGREYPGSVFYQVVARYQAEVKGVYQEVLRSHAGDCFCSWVLLAGDQHRQMASSSCADDQVRAAVIYLTAGGAAQFSEKKLEKNCQRNLVDLYFFNINRCQRTEGLQNSPGLLFMSFGLIEESLYLEFFHKRDRSVSVGNMY